MNKENRTFGFEPTHAAGSKREAAFWHVRKVPRTGSNLVDVYVRPANSNDMVQHNLTKKLRDKITTPGEGLPTGTKHVNKVIGGILQDYLDNGGE